MAHDCDVLVVGAGPVGTALALELALHRVSFRIIDKAAIRDDKSRALVIQPRTLELLNRHGAADTIVARGRILRGGAIYIDSKPVAKIDLDDLGTTDTEFKLPLNVSQAETEAFLDECLSEYGMAVERPVTATNITQDDSGVTVTLESPDGRTEKVRTKYVVGCDGAHSVVRHAAKNMIFAGDAYPQDYILCDVQLCDSNIAQDRISLHLSDKGVLGALPLNGELTRVVASRRQAVLDGDADLPTLHQLQAYFTSMTPPGSGTLHDPVWLTRFRLHHRCVNRYRDGRLFVAGDAAHIHSPAGGQGMNAGIQDAINLGWKLAHALLLQTAAAPAAATTASSSRDPTATKPSQDRNALLRAADALLDTYNLERRPVGLALLRGTDRIFSFISSPNPWFVPIRNFFLRHIFSRMTQSRSRRKTVFHFLSQFGVTYRGQSRIVGTASGSRSEVRGGDRLPDGRVWRVRGEDGGGREATSLQRICVGAPHHLLLFTGAGGMKMREVLKGVAEKAVQSCTAAVRVHYIAGGGGSVPEDDWYLDSDGQLHAKFGFGSKTGYVLVRPDGYVAHIGPLAKLDEFRSFLDGYLVSPVVTPLPPRRPWYPILWVAVAAYPVVKLLEAVAQRFRS